VAALIAVSSAASAADAPSSPYVQRLRWQAQLQTLNADLLSHDSATAVLQTLCDRRDPAAPRIRARRVIVADDADEAAAVRRELGAAANAAVKHRRVELTCGPLILSRADNWYLPDRLSPQMNETLETTDTPFGVVARPLKFQRRTLSARLLFEPLPSGWEAQSPARFDAATSPPAEVLQHRAMLQTPDGRPFSLLIETYSDKVLLP
jgi:hypothetical protein